MQIDITSLAQTDAFQYSASAAEMGQNAGQITWRNNLNDAPALLDTEEKKEAFRDFVREFGAWEEEEITAWDYQEMNALFHQFVMGDIREAGADALEDIDWSEYRERAEAGQCSSRLWRDESGEYSYNLSN
mgnify:FL=1